MWPRRRGSLSPDGDALPQPVADAARLFAGFDRWWALCGGWAVDAWLGRQTREHADVDIGILEEDQLALREFLAAGWLLNGHDPFDDDSTTQWDGHPLVVPAHVHARGHGFELDVQLERRHGEAWVLREEPRVAVAFRDAVRSSPWGVPTLAPETTLFYKSAPDRRTHDEADFRALLPILDGAARRWLRTAIARTQPEHRWLEPLT